MEDQQGGRRASGFEKTAVRTWGTTPLSIHRGEGRIKPVWLKDEKYWELPQAWFDSLVKRCLQRFGKVYIIQPYHAQEKCAPACWSAEGEVCECSCMGANHGSGHPGGRWKVVSDTFATRWAGRDLACRLLTRP